MKAALVYASRLKWRLLPVEPKGKKPILKDWPRLATSDAKTIKQWSEKYPDANLGVATGDTFFVVDVDPRNGGVETLEALEQEHGKLPETVRARTAGDGWHYLLRAPEGVKIGNGKLGPGIDIKGTGGQIVICPSSTEKGSYRWEVDPWDNEIAMSPAWVLERITRGAPKLKAVSQKSEDPKVAAFNDAHPIDFTTKTCPICGHHDCFGPLKDNPRRWSCFSASHERGGVRGEGIWHGDAVDLAAAEAGMSVTEFLSQEIDPLTEAKALIAAWRTAGQKDTEVSALVQRCRDIVAERDVDPVVRAQIEHAIISETGMKSKAIALPRAFVRAEPREITRSTGPDFSLSQNGSPHANLANAIKILEHETPEIWFDQFTQRVFQDDGGRAEEWTDANTLSLMNDWQCRHIPKLTKDMVHSAVVTYARSRPRDCVADWLTSLKWDGTPRIEEFFMRGLGAVDDDYNRAASANFWKSLVARPLNPGCKVDSMVVLEGEQGARKSTAVQEIVGDPRLFAEARENPKSKDFFAALQGKLIVEVAEFDAFSRSDVTTIKQVLSCRVDRYRQPFSVTPEDWPRRGIFVATTNSDSWQRDETGGRRFWPVACYRIDIPWIKANREQAFAEAVARMHEGWWEMPEASTRAAQEARFMPDAWEELLSQYLADKTEARTVDLLKHPLGIEVSMMTRTLDMRVAGVLRRIGWRKALRSRDGRPYRAWVKD